jgi:sugar transferase (PEP-CTERM system associated)
MKIFGNHVDRLVFSLAALEFALFVAVFAVAQLATSRNPEPHALSILVSAGGLAAILLLLLIATGGYRSEAWRLARTMVQRLLLSGCIGLLVILSAEFVFGRILDPAPPLSVLLPALGLALGGAAFVRWGGRRMRPLIGRLKSRAIVMGAGDRAAEVARLEKGNHRVTLLGFLPAGSEDNATIPGEQILPPTPTGLAQLAQRLGATEIVVALDERRGQLPIDELMACRLAGIDVIDADSFMERESGRIDLAKFRPGSIVFGDGFRKSSISDALKRALDAALALGLLVFCAPLFGLVALAIRLDDPGPIFYRQRRVGLDGRTFNILKFRSMVVDAERDGRARWASRGDPRITRVGYWIRRTRIDELPQVINVLKGEMSFVGPRPERPEFIAELTTHIPYYDFRHYARPGLTGWAQINYQYGASIEDARIKLQYDLYYQKHRTVLLDFVILLQTVRIVLSGEGAH